MKETKLYTCEICGLNYWTKEECKKCEKCHLIPTGIAQYKYFKHSSQPMDGDPIGLPPTKYDSTIQLVIRNTAKVPYRILINMNDGKNYWYHIDGYHIDEPGGVIK